MVHERSRDGDIVGGAGQHVTEIKIIPVLAVAISKTNGVKPFFQWHHKRRILIAWGNFQEWLAIQE